MSEHTNDRPRPEEGGVQLGKLVAEQLKPLLTDTQAEQARRRVWAQLATDILAETGAEDGPRRTPKTETATDSDRVEGVA